MQRRNETLKYYEFEFVFFFSFYLYFIGFVVYFLLFHSFIDKYLVNVNVIML